MRSQRGTVSVEFAAILPMLAVVVLLVAQVGLFVAEYLAVQHASREGARVIAVTDDPDAAREAVVRAGALDGARTQITITPEDPVSGEPVTVTVRYEATVFPLIARFLPPLTLSAGTTMRAEAEATG